MKTLQQISSILYQLDPMNTSCVENGLTDEYDDVAAIIFSGRSVKHAFFKQFYKNCLNNDQITTIEEQIRALA